MSSPVDASAYSKDNPFPALVTENRLLNKPGSHKETRHFIVSIEGSGLHYKAGDSLGVFPSNRPAEVDGLLAAAGLSGDEPVMLPKATTAITLREALSTKLALAGPTKKIVETLSHKATDETQKARLTALIAPEAKDELTGFLDDREFVDLFAEFPSAKVTAQELVDHMRKLMPRLYSIASSPRQHEQEIHLTVAIVRYETNHRERFGVCSTFLADRAEVAKTPTPVFVSHSHFGPPEDGAKDCIMVGPGTGIAPFRAFVQDRVASKATGRNWVFFGDQHAHTDFLYEEEWKQYVAAGHVTHLHTAFSRDQLQKIYVQDKMREHGAELWAWLKAGGYFFVCGDAKRMAKDVDLALHDIIAEHGKITPAEASEYVKALKKEKRYLRDVY